MAVIKINKTKNYTVMSNRHFKEKKMSLKAKGLLSMMLSLPEDWDYSINGLVAICKENKTTIKSTLNELKDFGYLVVTKKMPNETSTGRFEYIYDIYEQPQKKQKIEKQEAEKQGIEKQALEFQAVENPHQLNTKELNTNKSNIDELSIDNKKKERKASYDEILSSIEDADLKTLYLDYIKMRKLIKAPMTDRALQMLIKKVNELEPDSIDRQKQMLENAIMNNWKSVYPIKKEANNGQSYNASNKRCGDEYAFLE